MTRSSGVANRADEGGSVGRRGGAGGEAEVRDDDELLRDGLAGMGHGIHVRDLSDYFPDGFPEFPKHRARVSKQ